MKIFIYAENPQQMTALCGSARVLASDVEAVVINAECQQAAQADRIHVATLQPDALPEDYVASIAALLEVESPDIMLIEATRRNRLIAARLAALLGTSVLCDAMSIESDGSIAHLVYGGAAIRTERSSNKTALILVGADVLPSGEAQGENTITSFAFVEPKFSCSRTSVKKREKASVNLSAASRILGIGRGVKHEEDLEMIRAFASAIEAEIGCTRPIAEEEKWLPKETYIGVSGAMLSPDVYLAIGISGQVQHTVGINRAKTIIAINKEASAPIFKQADLGLVGDLYKVIPALTQALAE